MFLAMKWVQRPYHSTRGKSRLLSTANPFTRNVPLSPEHYSTFLAYKVGIWRGLSAKVQVFARQLFQPSLHIHTALIMSMARGPTINHIFTVRFTPNQWRTEGGLGGFKPPPPKFRRPSKIVPNSTWLWKLLKIAEFRTPTHKDVRK